MSAIAATNSSAADAVVSLLSNAASSVTNAGTPAAKATTSDPAASSARSNPGDIVDLSDRAKATLARAKTEQFAADKLTAQLQSARDPDGKNTAPKTNSEDGSQLFDKLSGRSQPQQTGDTQWVAGAPYGDPSISDGDFTAELKGTLLQQADSLPPEAGQALRNAVANGTLKFQKASDIPDLNFQSQHSFTLNAFGTWDGGGSTSQNPTGATKEAIDQGKAIAMWSADRGDIYITW
jgi:hypothetical protein